MSLLGALTLSLTACGKDEPKPTTAAAPTSAAAKAEQSAPEAEADKAAAKPAEAAKQPPKREVRGTGTLGDELAARAAASKAKMPQRFADLTAELFAKLRADKVTERALQVGAKAPDFSLPNASGKTVALKDLLAKGPVVLTWYRGGWCPYCNIQMRYYSRMVPELSGLGATLVAINPETPDESLTVKERHHLPFEVLSDAGQKVARAYGLVFELTPGLSKVYEARFKMSERQGRKPAAAANAASAKVGDGKAHDAKDAVAPRSELPLAATYVLDTNGTIRWAFLDVDYKKRAEPADILAAVRALQTPAKPAAAAKPAEAAKPAAATNPKTAAGKP